MATMTTTTTLADWKTPAPSWWCAGCGDFGVLNCVQRACAELGLLPHEILTVSGIGCSSNFPGYFNAYGMHTLHGRALAVATLLALSPLAQAIECGATVAGDLRLERDLVCAGDRPALTVTGRGARIDFNGHSLRGDGQGTGVLVQDTAGVVLQGEGRIEGFATGVEGLRAPRLAFMGVGTTPWRARRAEAVLDGQVPDEATLARAVAALREEIDPLPDLTNTPDTKRHLAGDQRRERARCW